MDAANLEQAIKFIKAHRPKQVNVDIKGWARIKRDLNKLSMLIDTPYMQIHPSERWLWHEKKALMRRAEIRILGTPVKMIR